MIAVTMSATMMTVPKIGIKLPALILMDYRGFSAADSVPGPGPRSSDNERPNLMSGSRIKQKRERATFQRARPLERLRLRVGVLSTDEDGRAVVGHVCPGLDLHECAVEAASANTHDAAEARDGRGTGRYASPTLVHGLVAGL